MFRVLSLAWLPRALFALCILAGVMVHTLGYVPITALKIVDTYLYDEKLRLSATGQGNQDVVVVDIDERSLAAEGRWPWSRDRMAALLDALFDHYGALSVGFDIVFAEPDTSSGVDTLRRLANGALRGNGEYQRVLRDEAPQLDYDARFAAALAGRPVVLGFYMGNPDEQVGEVASSGALPEPAMRAEDLGEAVLLPRWQRFAGNLPALQSAAEAGGYFNFKPDFDGNARRVPLFSQFGGQVYESLSLALLRVSLDNARLVTVFGQVPGSREEVLEAVRLVGPDYALRIPVDAHSNVLVNFVGPKGSHRYVSASEVLARRVPPEALAGKIVLVGTSAPGLLDLRATPMGGVFPGVEVHANLIGSVLDNRLKGRPGMIMAAEAGGLVLIALIMLFALHRLTPLKSSLLAAALLVTLIGIDVLAWQYDLVLRVGSGVVLIGSIYLFHMAWGYLTEFRYKKRFADLFGLYVPPELVAEMARAPEAYSMEGRSETLTVLFSDVRDFTTISEQLNARELAQLMNAYLDAMTRRIRERRGTLDKYIGDAIMAFWGAPVADAEHARHAVLAGLDMLAVQKQLAGEFAARGWPVLQIGIGINTGLMTVGDMGSSVRKAYTVMGDAVNLGARLEGLTKQYGLQLLVGESTMAHLADFACREIDLVRVKGKAIPVSIYEPLGLRGELPAEVLAEIEDWNRFRAAYRGRDWDAAERLLAGLLRGQPACRLYQLYAERLAHLRAHPPGADWDGVVVFETK